jgi:CheY-like chemotaxis protein
MLAHPKHVVLVVEDDPAIARLLDFQLCEAGWEVAHAPDGLTALRLWSSQPFTLVLLDVMLPDLSGWEICSILRQEEASSVPIIMLTAKSSDGDVVHGLNLGADDYLAKPFSNAQLLARIDAVMRRSTHQAPAAAAESAPTEAESAPAPMMITMAVNATPIGGSLLRDARQQAGMSLYMVERRLGIRWDYVQAMEQGAFGSIPRPLLKDMMLRYSAFLKVDARPVFAHAQRVLLSTPADRRSIRAGMVILSATIILLIILPFVLR